jgi:ABC-2 type transport system ATP-binding protein
LRGARHKPVEELRMASIRVAGLAKSYGGTQAVIDVTFSVDAGEVFVVLGPNGAGKTTTLEILEGHRSRDRGEVDVLGVDPAHGHGAWRARLGIMLQTAGVEDRATVAETLRRYGAYYPKPRPAEELLATVGLADRAGARVRELSGGGRRRLDLALALLGNPEVLFLDEPTAGFDPVARRATWDLCATMAAQGTAVLLTTHDMEEAEVLADRVAILAGGTIPAAGTLAELTAGHPSEVSFALPGGQAQWPLPAAVLAAATPADTAIPATAGDRVVLATADPAPLVAALARWAAAGGPRAERLAVRPPGLEAVYLAYAQEP